MFVPGIPEIAPAPHFTSMALLGKGAGGRIAIDTRLALLGLLLSRATTLLGSTSCSYYLW
jgi:hypothetical protein